MSNIKEPCTEKQIPPYPINKQSWVSRFRLETLGGLANLGLLGVRAGSASDNALPTDQLGETDLGVDLLHALEVGLGCAFGAKDDVLRVLS